jgi:CRISPR-associated exonuclease Cas4
MALDVALIAFFAVLAGLWGLWLLRRHRAADVLPPELRAAQLIYAERVFRFVGQVSITAKVDRAYRNAAGELVLLELKKRRVHRAHLSDVIELSAQRVAVMAQTGKPVARHGFVLTEASDGRGTAWHRVDLMRQGDVTALSLRRKALLAGEADARCARSPGICRTCPFARECRAS